jgi:hypothetical protein
VRLAAQQLYAENEPALVGWTAPRLSHPQVISSRPNTESLVLQPNVLPLPGSYIFTVVATDTAPSNSTLLRDATAAVFVEVLRSRTRLSMPIHQHCRQVSRPRHSRPAATRRHSEA